MKFFAALLMVMFVVLAAKPAFAECPPYPQVQWWKNLSHKSTRDYIASRNGGDWKPYIKKWEKELQKVTGVYDRGNAIIVSSKRIKLRNTEILTYINNIEKRLDVVRCLAASDQGVATAQNNTEETVFNITIDESAGEAVAKSKGCTECHRKLSETSDPTAPKLNGQNDLYLIKQMKEFQTLARSTSPRGSIERYNFIMETNLQDVDDDEIRNLAAYYSSLPCSGGAKADNPGHDAPEVVAACIKCHGVSGKSVFPEVPNLAGQNNNYLVKQLKSFRSSANSPKNDSEDWRYHYIMSKISGDMSDAEITVASNHFSSLSCR